MGNEESNFEDVNENMKENKEEQKQFRQKMVQLKINKQRVIQLEQFLDVISNVIFFTKEFEKVLVEISENPKLKKNKKMLQRLEFENMRAVQAISMSEINIGSRCNKKDYECLKLGGNLVMDYVNSLLGSNIKTEVKEQILPLIDCVIRMFKGKRMAKIPPIKLRQGSFNKKNVSKLLTSFVQSQIELNKKEKRILNNYVDYHKKQQKALNNNKTDKNYKQIKDWKTKKSNPNDMSKYYKNQLKTEDDSDSSDTSDEDGEEALRNYYKNYSKNQHLPNLTGDGESDFSDDDDTSFLDVQWSHKLFFQERRDIVNHLKIGDKIDFQATNKKYYKAIVIDFRNNKINLKLCNVDNENINKKVTVDIYNINPTRFARYKFITIRPAHELKHLKVNDEIKLHLSYIEKLQDEDINNPNLNVARRITKIDKFSGQVQMNNRYWIHLDDPRVKKIDKKNETKSNKFNNNNNNNNNQTRRRNNNNNNNNNNNRTTRDYNHNQTTRDETNTTESRNNMEVDNSDNYNNNQRTRGNNNQRRDYNYNDNYSNNNNNNNNNNEYTHQTTKNETNTTKSRDDMDVDQVVSDVTNLNLSNETN